MERARRCQRAPFLRGCWRTRSCERNRLARRGNRPWRWLTRRRRRDDRIAEPSDAVDADFHPIARLEKHRRLPRETDTGGRTSRDHVPWLERDAVRDER